MIASRVSALRRSMYRQGTGVSPASVYQVHDVLCSHFLIAFLLWVFSRMPTMRELLATGANECRALIGTMVAAAAKRNRLFPQPRRPSSRSSPQRRVDFDSKQMRGHNACFCDRC